MKLFRHENREASEASRKLYARFEIAHTIVDFSAAFCFVVGSLLFFYDETQKPATWLFLVGSIFFAIKPTLKIVREIKLYRLGDLSDLADRYTH
tara:strand:+ start:302 stop:583 length:282 start_codon:yes stop_codon:yes gene_type:complete